MWHIIAGFETIICEIPRKSQLKPEKIAIKVGTQSHRIQKRGINRINTNKPSEFVFMGSWARGQEMNTVT